MYKWEPKNPEWIISFSFYLRLNFYTYSFIRLDIYNNRKTKNNNKTKNMDDSFDDFLWSTENDIRRLYLLKYAQADIQKFPNCSTFSECILNPFTKGKSRRTVKEWTSCLEDHGEGGKHCHMTLNLSGTRRWQPVKNYICNRDKFSVNFSTKNCGYVAAYRYVCKDKHLTDVLHSPGHSDMSKILSPLTKNAMKKISIKYYEETFFCNRHRKNTHPKSQKNAVKKKRLNIRKESELMQAALQKRENVENNL